MRPSDFRYTLPESQIAQYPSARRGDSRLLFLDGESGEIRDLRFRQLPELLRPGDLMVLNDTRVIPARLHGSKESGGRVEVLIERVLDSRRVLARVRASRAPRPGSRLRVAGTTLELAARREGGLFELRLESGEGVEALLGRAGRVPLPPYIRRPDEALDRERYQTVYARHAGAVAAPTAGLHFDRGMLGRLRRRGVEQTFVTLHVASGTFRPVRAERVAAHRMHAERAEIPASACARVNAARARGARVVAVGTTSVRVLESAWRGSGVRPFAGETDLFIYPGYRFRCVDAMITNFHLPESTLLMLVAAFAGRERVLGAYRHAVAAGYRFYSYGDAMLVTRGPQPDPGAGEARAAERR